jgi:hypothetical protein
MQFIINLEKNLILEQSRQPKKWNEFHGEYRGIQKTKYLQNFSSEAWNFLSSSYENDSFCQMTDGNYCAAQAAGWSSNQKRLFQRDRKKYY